MMKCAKKIKKSVREKGNMLLRRKLNEKKIHNAKQNFFVIVFTSTL